MARRIAALLAVVALGCSAGACGNRGAAPAEPLGVPSTEVGAGAFGSAAPRLQSTTPTACTLEPGRDARRIDVAGVAREYVRVVGEHVKEGPAPVLFVWHGFGSRPEQMLAGVRPELWADAIVVAPLGLPRTFEQFGDTERAGFQVHAGEHGDRDLQLFDAMLEELRATGCIDDTRVYTTGFSNGGFFSNVLACHRGDRIAAAAPVGGGGPFVFECGPPVPVFVTHGRADEVVPIRSAEASWAFWLKHDGCAETPPLPSDGCLEVTDCATESLMSACVFGGGHTWPRDQAARVREFLIRHVRPVAPGR